MHVLWECVQHPHAAVEEALCNWEQAFVHEFIVVRLRSVVILDQSVASFVVVWWTAEDEVEIVLIEVHRLALLEQHRHSFPSRQRVAHRAEARTKTPI